MSSKEITTNHEARAFTRSEAGLRRWENHSYKSGLDVFNAIRSGKYVYWKGIWSTEPILQDFLHIFTDHLPGSPPTSMVLSEELRQPQDFLNGHSIKRLYDISMRLVREEEGNKDVVAYLLNRAGIPTTASDIFAANRLGRIIPWDRDFSGPTLLTFLEEIKAREEKESSQTMPPISLWGRKELEKRYTSFQGKSLYGLFNYLKKASKKKGMEPIPFLREKLGVQPTVDDVIQVSFLGGKIDPEAFTPVVIEELLIRAADELGIDRSEIHTGHLRNTSFHFFGDRPLDLLVTYARRYKPANESVSQFLLKHEGRRPTRTPNALTLIYDSASPATEAKEIVTSNDASHKNLPEALPVVAASSSAILTETAPLDAPSKTENDMDEASQQTVPLTAEQLLEKEVREKARATLLARARIIGSTNGAITYSALKKAGFFTEDLSGLFPPNGVKTFLEILGIRSPIQIRPATNSNNTTPSHLSNQQNRPTRAELQEIVDETLPWINAAKCRGKKPEDFYTSATEQKEVKLFCRSCIVRLHCLADALVEEEKFGVRGGMTEREIHAMQRRISNPEDRAELAYYMRANEKHQIKTNLRKK